MSETMSAAERAKRIIRAFDAAYYGALPVDYTDETVLDMAWLTKRFEELRPTGFDKAHVQRRVEFIAAAIAAAEVASREQALAEAERVCRERAAKCQSVVDAAQSDGTTKAQARYCVSAVMTCADAIRALRQAASVRRE